MVRRRAQRGVSNHEATHLGLILRDARNSELLRMRGNVRMMSNASPTSSPSPRLRGKGRGEGQHCALPKTPLTRTAEAIRPLPVNGER